MFLNKNTNINNFLFFFFFSNGFPTIFFAPGNNKASPLTYNGERKVGDFVDYLKKNANKMTKKPKTEKSEEL